MGLDFDIRYNQILKLVNFKKDNSVLEVGALPPACLYNYIGKKINYFGIDKNYSNTKYRIKKMDFLSNKFQDNSFSFCISTDTLEHIRKNDREKFIDEIIRVGKDKIIIGVPNPESGEYEKILVNLLEASNKGKHYVHFFKEHDEFGLPSRKDMKVYLRKYKYTIIENFNLKYWIGILLCDVFDLDIDVKNISDINGKPAYRTFYIIEK